MRARCPDCVHLTASTYIYPPTLAQDKAHQLWCALQFATKAAPTLWDPPLGKPRGPSNAMQALDLLWQTIVKSQRSSILRKPYYRTNQCSPKTASDSPSWDRGEPSNYPPLPFFHHISSGNCSPALKLDINWLCNYVQTDHLSSQLIFVTNATYSVGTAKGTKQTFPNTKYTRC